MQGLIGTVLMNELENEGTLSFFGTQTYMTKNFSNTFGEESSAIVFTAVSMIMEAHPDGADYFQTFCYEWADGHKTKFWLIIDETENNQPNILTALLPEDY